jgi:hypothetical protein
MVHEIEQRYDPLDGCTLRAVEKLIIDENTSLKADFALIGGGFKFLGESRRHGEFDAKVWKLKALSGSGQSRSTTVEA